MSNRLLLSRKHQRILEALVREFLPDVEVWAFGSRVNGRGHEGSDLDLVLRGPGLQEIPLDQLVDFEDAVRESIIPFLVETRDWARLPERFQREIERRHVVMTQCTDLDSTRPGPDTERSEFCPAMPFDEAFRINPLVSIKRGTPTPFVEMAAVNPSIRTVGPTTVREFRGSGSKFRSGDTLLARITPSLENGKIARYWGRADQEVGHGSTEFIVIRGREGITDSDYAYYVARSDLVRSYAIGQMTGTSGRQRVPVESLAHLDVAIPPLAEQRAIAHILGTLDDKIELNRRMNETLEATARALFKSWFVDFDPVRAKMEGRDTGLPEHLANLFPDRLTDSEMGKVPERWQTATLAKVIELHDRKRIPLNKRQRSRRQGPYPYYGAAGIMDYVDDYLFDGVHILTGEDGSVVDNDGHPIVQYVWDRFWVNNHAHVIKGTGAFSDEHIYLLLKHTNITAFVTGAVQPKLNQKNLNAIPIVVPSNPTCRAFSRLVSPLFARLRYNVNECSLLAALRDALLPKLISGEVRVPSILSYV